MQCFRPHGGRVACSIRPPTYRASCKVARVGLELVVEGRGGRPQSVRASGPLLTVGRETACDIILPDPSVSARHAMFRQLDATYLLTDEGSANGVFVRGVRLAPRTGHVVKDGDVVRFGAVSATVFLAPDEDGPLDRLTSRELAIALARRMIEASEVAGRPRLRVVAGPDEGRALDLDASGREVTVGRDPACGLRLSEALASRHHVAVALLGSTLTVRDLGSRNGCALDGAPLREGAARAWPQGGRLQIGEDVIVYEHRANPSLAAPAEAPVTEGAGAKPALPAPRKGTVMCDRPGLRPLERVLLAGLLFAGLAGIAYGVWLLVS